MKRLFCLMFFFSSIIPAQNFSDVPRDTSFNIRGTAVKVQKQYPFAKVVVPSLSDGVTAEADLIYTAYGARNLHLDLFYNTVRAEKPSPAVILVHGGGWRSGDKSHQIPMAQKLASVGFVTAAVEYRLSTEALYPAAVHDLKSAIRWMRANAGKYNVDTNKIAILGCSSGGQLAALVGTTNNDKNFESGGNNSRYSSSVQAIIDIDGVLDFSHEGAKAERRIDPEKPAAAFLWFGCTYDENPELWKQASAYFHVDKNTPPTAFINSSLDRFHAGRDEMIAKLNTYGIYSEAQTIPDTPHPFWLFHPWFEITFDYTEKFLRKVFTD